VKCLVDAQLPQQSAYFLTSKNIESKHTLGLPRKNKTPDGKIIQIADQEGRIVITKDSDFLDNYILDGKPKQLLIVSTGNISNKKLIRLFETNLQALKSLFQRYSVIEIDEAEIQVHY
jgi:predicted nuclease of predicted toxin-antitoxin system